jgi:tetratricopeptide (TPR) repeat protein
MESRQMRARVRILLILATWLSLTATAIGQQELWKDFNSQVEKLYQAGRYSEGVEVATRALKTAEQSLGPDHPDVATGLNNLAVLYMAQGKYSEAEPLHKRALAIREKALGPDHPDVAISLENLAVLYEQTGRTEEANKLRQRLKKKP